MNLPFPPPDPRLILVPWHLVHLSHTSLWLAMRPEERLTSNRLMGLLINEVFECIEHRLILATLDAIRRGSFADRPPWPGILDQVMGEERKHLAWFQEYDRQAGLQGSRMLRLPPWVLRMMGMLASSRMTQGTALWVMLATEEWATRFAMLVLESAESAPGSYDPAYIALHRAHLGEERRHAEVDARLILEQGGDQRMAIRFLGTAMRLVLTPRRGVRRMIDRLVLIHPRLAGIHDRLSHEACAIGRTAGYWQGILKDGLPITDGLIRDLGGGQAHLMPGLAAGKRT